MGLSKALEGTREDFGIGVGGGNREGGVSRACIVDKDFGEIGQGV